MFGQGSMTERTMLINSKSDLPFKQCTGLLILTVFICTNNVHAKYMAPATSLYRANTINHAGSHT